jgi:Restriction endonuclease
LGLRSAAATPLISAAVAVLADGRPRSGAALLAEAIQRGLLPSTTRELTLYTSLNEYIMRALAHGRKPAIVQDERSHEFRINHPLDDWPDVALPARALPYAGAAADALAERLRTTATGGDPAAFEAAVCDAFALLGFVAQHVGGIGAPDGILDAPLGPLAYRAIVECKTATPKATVAAPRLEEPAKFRDAYGAQFAVLVGPAFAQDASFSSEMTIHRVAVWTVEDLVRAFALGVDPLECRDLFATGPVTDRMDDLAWDRAHGAEKRLAVIGALLHRAAWAAQCEVVRQVAPADAPVVTLDSALLIVDAALAAANATGGATRAEVETAMHDLVRTGVAVTVPNSTGIVMRRGPSP